MRKLLSNDQRRILLAAGHRADGRRWAFDTVFRWACSTTAASPLVHLWQLKDQLAPGGELVLETLVVEGDENTVLVPGDRAQCARLF